MSTGVVIAIIVAAIVLIAIFAMVLPRSRARARERKVEDRRREVAGVHREAASERMARAELAEREARRDRAEAELHETRAKLHEDGLADEELDRDPRVTGDTRFTRDRDADGVDDRTETGGGRTAPRRDDGV
jgi:hypothetical protein